MLVERARRMADSGYAEEADRLTAAALQIERSHPELFPELFSGAGRRSQRTETASFANADPQDAGDKHRPAVNVADRTATNDAAGPDVELLPEPPGPSLTRHAAVAANAVHAALPATDSQTQITARGDTGKNSVIARVSANGGPQEVGVSRTAIPDAKDPVDSGKPLLSDAPPTPRQARRSFVSIMDGIETVDEPRAALAMRPTPRPVPGGDSNPSAPESSTPSDTADESANGRGWETAGEPARRFDPSLSRLNTTSLAGLCIGLSGLIGLSLWRRLERRHFVAAVR